MRCSLKKKTVYLVREKSNFFSSFTSDPNKMGKTFIEEEILDFPLSSAGPLLRLARVNEHKRTQLRSMESSDSDNSGLERLF